MLGLAYIIIVPLSFFDENEPMSNIKAIGVAFFQRPHSNGLPVTIRLCKYQAQNRCADP